MVVKLRLRSNHNTQVKLHLNCFLASHWLRTANIHLWLLPNIFFFTSTVQSIKDVINLNIVYMHHENFNSIPIANVRFQKLHSKNNFHFELCFPFYNVVNQTSQTMWLFFNKPFGSVLWKKNKQAVGEHIERQKEKKLYTFT